MKLTKTQATVLRRLRDGWLMDPHGKDDLGGAMIGPKNEFIVIAPKTVSFLFGECLISTNPGGISYWKLTNAGLSAVS